MAFVSFDSAESITIGTNGFADDGSGSNDAALVDNNTGTSASGEIRAGMNCYKAIIDLTFPVAELDNSNLSIRIFDGTIMTAAGLCVLHPYIDGNSVHASVSEVAAVNDNAAYDEFLMPSAWVDELVDVGTDQIAVRFFASGSGRGRFNELQIEFSQEISVGPITATPDPHLVISATADLLGRGVLDATPTPHLVISATADLLGRGQLDAPPSMAFSATADLALTPGVLEATPDLTFSFTTVDLEARGKLDAPPLLAFTASPDLLARGKLDATPDPHLVFSLAADLVGQVIVPFPYHIFKEKNRDMRGLITL